MEPSLDCRTPPTSPELSRLKTKRRCPFGECPQPSKVPASESVMARDDSSTRTTDQSSTSITGTHLKDNIFLKNLWPRMDNSKKMIALVLNHLILTCNLSCFLFASRFHLESEGEPTLRRFPYNPALFVTKL